MMVGGMVLVPKVVLSRHCQRVSSHLVAETGQRLRCNAKSGFYIDYLGYAVYLQSGMHIKSAGSLAN